MTKDGMTLSQAWKRFVDPDLQTQLSKARRTKKLLPRYEIVRPERVGRTQWSQVQKDARRLTKRAVNQLASLFRRGELVVCAYPADKAYQDDPVELPAHAWHATFIPNVPENSFKLGPNQFVGAEVFDRRELPKRQQAPPERQRGPASLIQVSREVNARQINRGAFAASMRQQADMIRDEWPNGIKNIQPETIRRHISADWKTADDLRKAGKVVGIDPITLRISIREDV